MPFVCALGAALRRISRAAGWTPRCRYGRPIALDPISRNGGHLAINRVATLPPDVRGIQLHTAPFVATASFLTALAGLVVMVPHIRSCRAGTSLLRRVGLAHGDGVHVGVDQLLLPARLRGLWAGSVEARPRQSGGRLPLSFRLSHAQCPAGLCCVHGNHGRGAAAFVVAVSHIRSYGVFVGFRYVMPLEPRRGCSVRYPSHGVSSGGMRRPGWFSRRCSRPPRGPRWRVPVRVASAPVSRRRRSRPFVGGSRSLSSRSRAVSLSFSLSLSDGARGPDAPIRALGLGDGDGLNFVCSNIR